MQHICRTKEAPFLRTLAIINGKWKFRILYELACETTLRYGELKRNLAPITHKMLSDQLKDLAADDMIVRHIYPEVPPRVDYSLSPKGLTFLPIMVALCDWGKEHTAPSKT
ncbi:winged helix-turn-helix transcriptional regulator [Megasphaera cerevisiae]|jgi:DNA-binding HxlR family transcriptional regulator|uniref:winged helix-turn-helix transcriptional regulator n=1 Tax=Megasphaera cerevisiae TaxID=39029 RepID=UPI000943435F|nr:helix-turn-helix domain-containing protein [Megasphaera cerevisiae]MCI1751036.1 helix-turn-helix transcriptional regulator [Megasphaera cerevisiae]OKY53521.1 hypothetical protein BSR42_06995 [Megasphaera cerevisiae]